MAHTSPKFSLVLYGDSFLGRFGILFIDELEKRLKNITVYNCATGGQNTQDGLLRVELISRLKPDYVLLSFGANDASTWRKKISEKEFRANYKKILQSFPDSKLILFPCPPVHNPKNLQESEGFNKILARYNDIIKSVASQNGAEYIDSQAVYGNLLRSDRNYHGEDGFHLNAEGYMQLINEIEKIITSTSSPK